MVTSVNREYIFYLPKHGFYTDTFLKAGAIDLWDLPWYHFTQDYTKLPHVYPSQLLDRVLVPAWLAGHCTTMDFFIQKRQEKALEVNLVNQPWLTMIEKKKKAFN